MTRVAEKMKRENQNKKRGKYRRLDKENPIGID